VEKITQAREQSEKIKKNHPALQVGVPAREIFLKKKHSTTSNSSLKR
jgi:hypothetical protein